MTDCNFDPTYEYNAPKFIDFTQGGQDEEQADLWFDNHIEEDDNKPFQNGLAQEEETETPVEKEIDAIKDNNNDVQLVNTQIIQEEKSLTVEKDIDAVQDENTHSQQVCVQSPQHHSEDCNSQLKQENESSKPAQHDTETDQQEQPANFKTLWGSVVNDQEVPANLRTSWDARKPTEEPAKSKSSAVNRPKVKIAKPVRRSVPTRASAKASTSRNVTPKSNARRSDGSAGRPLSAKKKSTDLTVPSTPSFVRRAQVKRPQSEPRKSTEEMQMERIKSERKRLHELSRKNEKSKIKALHASPYMPLRSNKELTQPIQLQFHTDQAIAKRNKEHPMTLRSDNSTGELAAYDFARQLRKNTTASKNAATTTRPKSVQPFTFATASRKRKVDDGVDEQTHESYVPLAELVNSYHSGTPKRFRGQSTPNQTDNHDQPRPKVTCPKSPALKTGQRARSSREKVLSYRELEDKEVEEMKQHKFRAKPFDPKIFENSCTGGIRNKATAGTTKPIGFSFHSDKRRSSNSEKRKEESQNEATNKCFKAQPIPAKILEGVTGVKKIEQAPLTIPQSPALIGKQRHALYEQKLLEKPAEKPYVFKARPLPADNDELPEKKHISPTKVKPFDMPGVKVSEIKCHKRQEQLEEEERTAKDSQKFKARPNTVTYSKAFEPKRSSKPLTDITEFKLNTTGRVQERQKFEKDLKAKEEYKHYIEEKKKIEVAEIEKKEVMELRKQMTHKANPIHQYKNVDIQGSDKPLTVPYSPNFAKVRSLRA